MAKILGISAFYHDSAACLLVDGEILAAVQEERFNRIKHFSGFPTEAIKYCLLESGLKMSDLDAIVFYDKPLLKFERLIESYYSIAPRGLRSFLQAIPVWLDEKLFLKSKIIKGLREIEDFQKKKVKFFFPEHHLSHAASAYYCSEFKESAILTVDGVGEYATASLSYGQGENITTLKEMHFPHSLGLLYSAFTYYLGFKVNSGEYKMMGLAPFGIESDDETKGFISKIESTLVKIYDDGSIWMDQSYYNYVGGLTMANNDKWAQCLGISKREAETEINQSHCNLALAIQKLTEKVVVKMATELKRITKSENICLAGGVALNCVANGKLQKAGIFKNIFIQPAAGDAGASLGAALAVNASNYNGPRPKAFKNMGSLLGPHFDDIDIGRMNRRTKARTQKLETTTLFSEVAKALNDGLAIGWFQGRMEFGPRALGNRSIIADPRNPEMQKRLNLKIKNRESFRPFAPAVLKEKAAEIFDLDTVSPYMLLVAPLQNNVRKAQVDNYDQLGMSEKLYTIRSEYPAITHVDYSARVQTVDKEINPRFHGVIEAFYKQTGCPLVINTSFNVRGEPIVCTPEDAFNCFMSTDMDVLVINNWIYWKSEQQERESTGVKSERFQLD